MTDYGAATSITLAAATSTEVLAARAGRRIGLSIANVGANPAYVNFSNSETATASSGIYLAAGGIITDGYEGTIPPWQGRINAISTAGTTLSVWERVVL